MSLYEARESDGFDHLGSKAKVASKNTSPKKLLTQSESHFVTQQPAPFTQ